MLLQITNTPKGIIVDPGFLSTASSQVRETRQAQLEQHDSLKADQHVVRITLFNVALMMKHHIRECWIMKEISCCH